MRLAGQRLIALAPKLAALNRKLAAARDPAEQYAHDSEFHRVLTCECGNTRLIKLLDAHRQQARLFDGAHERGTADQSGSCREHAEIVAAIEKGRIEDACALLTAHWRRGEDVVIAWLKERA